MICKVKLVQEAILIVEAKDEDAAYDWLMNTTPEEAATLGKICCNYHEEVMRILPDDVTPDYRIKA